MKRSANISNPVAVPNQNPRKPFPAWRLINGVTNASDDDLDASADSCENWSWYFGGLVAFGLIAEVILGVLHPPYDSVWSRWGSTLANALVFIGVAGEVQFSRMGFRRGHEIKRRSDEKVAEATGRAAEAVQKASEADDRTSIANLKAQEAIHELAKFRASRILTGRQIVRIPENLKQFSGTEYDMALHSNDTELTGFLCFIETALLKAGWKALSWPAAAMFITPRGIQVAVGISVTNIVVGMHLEKVSLLLPAAKCLADELMVAGTATVTPMPDSHGMSPNTTAIHILIGRKS